MHDADLMFWICVHVHLLFANIKLNKKIKATCNIIHINNITTKMIAECKELFDEDDNSVISDFEIHFSHNLVPELKQMFSFNIQCCHDETTASLQKFINNISNNTSDCCYINDSGNSYVNIVYTHPNIYEFGTGTYSGKVYDSSSFTVQYDMLPMLKEILQKMLAME